MRTHRFSLGAGLAILVVGLALGALTGIFSGGQAAGPGYTPPPANGGGITVQWYWQIGGGTLPSMTSGTAATANVWDTDLFNDSGGSVPTGPSSTVTALHAANKYSICYVEAGAYQEGFPDDSAFATADYGGVGDTATQMQGYPDEFWFDLTGFKSYVAGNAATLTGAASNIAAGLDARFADCKREGQDAVEPDDLDGYTNQAQSGVTPWGMTQADAAGFERWLAFDIHQNGLAAFQKNDGANTGQDVSIFDGFIIEECNHYDDPCGSGGDDANLYITAHKPVLNAEYTQDGESTGSFCSADTSAGITGTLFDVNLAGGTDSPCATGSGYTYGGGVVTTTTTPTTSTSSTSTSSSTTSSTTTTTTTTTAPGTPVNTKRPVISGTPKQGHQLKTTTGSWTNHPTSYTYAWIRCRATATIKFKTGAISAEGCVVVTNAHKQTYNLGSGDVGATLDAVVTAHNAAGAASAYANATRKIADPPKHKRKRG